ncbi:DNA repair protein [gamma proteobacterium IMCC1989]|nr:DNA repair protein [gamma proteobacterium IMCC1989]
MNKTKNKHQPESKSHDTIGEQHNGISESQILAWAESILEARFKRSNYITSPSHTREYLSVTLADKEREVFCMIYLDSQHGIIDFEILFHGTIDAASVYPREVVKSALKYNAAAIILAHNHPSGSPEPSSADKRITDQIITALKTVDIRVLDHLIVGGTQSISFAELGLL